MKKIVRIAAIRVTFWLSLSYGMVAGLFINSLPPIICGETPKKN